jgi:hypothetical protein
VTKAERATPAEGGPLAAIDDLAARKIVSHKTAIAPSPQARKDGRRSRNRGAVVERDAADRHRAIGIHAERYSLSGASRFRGSGHDMDIYALGKDEAPLVYEATARSGFATLKKWLGDYDALFLRRNNANPMLVVLTRCLWTLLPRLVRQ